ncbi:MAG: glycosyltransferase [Cyanobacteria bacterium P01_A01_bin.135]
MPKVSVIIPAYNAMAYLEATLSSVLQQTFEDFEVLMIDDGSSDHIREWALGLEDSRVKLICQKNQKVARARNNGISQAVGEYIAFLDSDDLWEKTKLEKQVKYLDAHAEVGLVSTKVKIVDQAGNHIRNFLVPTKERISLGELLSYNYMLCGSTPLVRQSCFKKVGLFDTNLNVAEDWDLWIRIAFHYSIAVVLEYLVSYRQHPRNSSKNIRAMVNEIEQIAEKNRGLVSPSLHSVLNERVATAKLNASWGIMEEGRYLEALSFSMGAFTRDPKVALSWSFIRLQFFTLSRIATGGRHYSVTQRLSPKRPSIR